MHKKSLLVVAVLTLLVVCQSFAQNDKHAADENATRKADAAWSQAAQTKDLEKCVSFYAEDASVLPFNAPIATGKEQIRQLWSHLMGMPGFSLSFAPTKIEIAKAGDMAYEVGTFELKANDAQGNPTSTTGKYVVAWAKQADHQWKAKADIFNTDK